MLQIFLSTTPFYQRGWFWTLAFFVTLFVFFYALRWIARRRYQEIIQARRSANARIRELLKQMKDK
ncbi:MAG: hypothetical protein AB8G22_21880 [Saprospiraceae bacterium]